MIDIDWNKELEIYTIDEILEYNDIPLDEEVIAAIEDWNGVVFKIPAATVNAEI